ncbi:MAG: hypothetical protein MI864_20275 [Pseudomonadales bacterium]|nr:hypothetical protein [Pseudomonadales bacterium]
MRIHKGVRLRKTGLQASNDPFPVPDLPVYTSFFLINTQTQPDHRTWCYTGLPWIMQDQGSSLNTDLTINKAS